MKKIFTRIMKLFYKYDSRYTIVKNKELKYDKTVVWSLDHSWNSVEWCLPGLYFLRKYYNVNMVFFAGDSGLWQRCLEEENVYNIIQKIFDVIIINTYDELEHNWINRHISRLKTSLLREESLKFFFKNISVDVLLSMYNPTYVNKYFLEYHPHTIMVGYEHGICNQIGFPGKNYNKIILSGKDYHFCTDSKAYDLAGDYDERKLVVVGAPQLDLWWRKLISNDKLLNLQKQLGYSKKRILILLPALGNIRLNEEEVKDVLRVIKYFHNKENVLLKFHPRENKSNRTNFMQSIYNYCQDDNIIVTTMSTECVATIADCVVVVGITSAAGAASINDVPVIEFHNDKNVEGFYYEDGQYGTLLRVKGAIMGANNYESLRDAVNQVLYDNAWDAYRGKYKKYILHDDLSSKRFAESLMHILYA